MHIKAAASPRLYHPISFARFREIPQSRDAAVVRGCPRVAEIANRECKAVSVSGCRVTLFDLDGEYFAPEGARTHWGRDFSEVCDGRA